jgi:hypothetical protein
VTSSLAGMVATRRLASMPASSSRAPRSARADSRRSLCSRATAASCSAGWHDSACTFDMCHQHSLSGRLNFSMLEHHITAVQARLGVVQTATNSWFNPVTAIGVFGVSPH